MAKNQSPPLEIPAVELGEVPSNRFEMHTEEFSFSVTLDGHIDHLVNHLAFLSAQPEFSADEIRITASNPKLKNLCACLCRAFCRASWCR